MKCIHFIVLIILIDNYIDFDKLDVVQAWFISLLCNNRLQIDAGEKTGACNHKGHVAHCQ